MVSQIGKLLKVQRSEWAKVLLLSAHSAAAIAVLVLVQSLISALFLEKYDTALLPYLFSGQAIFYVIVSSYHSAITGRISRKAETYGILMIFMAMMAISRMLLFTDQGWSVFAVYIVLQTLVDILIVQSGITVMDSFTTREAKRLQSVVNAGGTMGAVAGGFFVSTLAGVVGTENLLVVSIPCLGLMLFTGSRIIKTYIRDEPSVKPRKGGGMVGGMREAVNDVFGERLFVLYLVVFIGMIISSTVIDFQFKSLLKASYTKDQMTSFLGVFFAVVNTATLLVQLFVAGRVMMGLGLVVSILVQPVVLLAGSCVFFLHPSLWVIAGTRLFENICKYTVFKGSSNMVYMPLPQVKQSRMKISAGGIFRPVAILAASSMIIAAGKLVGLGTMSLIVIGSSAAAVVAGVKLKRPFVEKLKESLNDRRIRLRDNPVGAGLVGLQARRMIEKGLDSADEGYVRFSLELIRDNLIPIEVEKMRALLVHPCPDVRLDALATMAELGGDCLAPEVAARLDEAEGYAEKARCVRVLRMLEANGYAAIVGEYLESPDARLAGEAAAYTALYGDAGSRRRVLEFMEGPHNETGPAGRASVFLYVAAEMGDKKYLDEALRLMKSRDREVGKHAVGAAGMIGGDDAIRGIIGVTGDPRLASVAASVLSGMGPRAVRLLAEAYPRYSISLEHRLGILGALSRTGSAEGGKVIASALSDDNPEIRARAITSLNRLARRCALGEDIRKTALKACREEASRGAAAAARIEMVSRLDESVLGGMRREMLVSELLHRLSRNRENVFGLLAVAHDRHTIYKAYFNYMGPNKRERDNALELLDNLLDREVSEAVLPLIESTPGRDGALKKTEGYSSVMDAGWPGAFADEGDPWIKKVAAWTFWWAYWMEGAEIPGCFSGMEVGMLEKVELIYFLKSVPMFSALSGEELGPLAELFKEEVVPSGRVVFEQGGMSDGFYLIQYGKMRVERDGRQVAVLSRGDYFGEMALIDDEQRSATVTAEEDCELLRLDRDEFHELLEEYPALSMGIIRTLTKRLRGILEDV